MYDGDGVVLSFDGAGSLTHRYLHGDAVDQVFASEDALGEVLWALTDYQGSVRDIADYDVPTDTLTFVDHRQFDSFGNVTSESNPSVEFRYYYSGRFFDADTGLQYNRARWYDPQVGRWISEDPIGFNAGDANLSRYVANSPGNYTDPSGLSVWPDYTESYKNAPSWLKPFMKPDPADFISPMSFGEKAAKPALKGFGGFLKGLFKSKVAEEIAPPVMETCTKSLEKAAIREGVLKAIAESRAARLAKPAIDEAAALKSFRRYTERLLQRKAPATTPALRRQLRLYQKAMAKGDEKTAGRIFHSLVFNGVRSAKGPQKRFFKFLKVDRVLKIPKGGFTKCRRPDFLFENTMRTFDLKPFRPKRTAYDNFRQFLDILRATGKKPTPLYYKLRK